MNRSMSYNAPTFCVKLLELLNPLRDDFSKTSGQYFHDSLVYLYSVHV